MDFEVETEVEVEAEVEAEVVDSFNFCLFFKIHFLIKCHFLQFL